MTNISCKKQPRLPIVEVAFYFVFYIKGFTKPTDEIEFNV